MKFGNIRVATTFEKYLFLRGKVSGTEMFRNMPVSIVNHLFYIYRYTEFLAVLRMGIYWYILLPYWKSALEYFPPLLVFENRQVQSIKNSSSGCGEPHLAQLFRFIKYF